MTRAGPCGLGAEESGLLQAKERWISGEAPVKSPKYHGIDIRNIYRNIMVLLIIIGILATYLETMFHTAIYFQVAWNSL